MKRGETGRILDDEPGLKRLDVDSTRVNLVMKSRRRQVRMRETGDASTIRLVVGNVSDFHLAAPATEGIAVRRTGLIIIKSTLAVIHIPTARK